MGHVDVVHTRRLDGSAVEEELLVRYLWIPVNIWKEEAHDILAD